METVNPFDILNQKLDIIIKRLDVMDNVKKTPFKMTLKDFCKQENISRVTAYAWDRKGLICLHKIGGRQYVSVDDIFITKKYQGA